MMKRITNFKSVTLGALLALAGSIPALAQESYRWTGGGTTNNWSEVANWEVGTLTGTFFAPSGPATEFPGQDSEFGSPLDEDKVVVTNSTIQFDVFSVAVEQIIVDNTTINLGGNNLLVTGGNSSSFNSQISGSTFIGVGLGFGDALSIQAQDLTVTNSVFNAVLFQTQSQRNTIISNDFINPVNSPDVGFLILQDSNNPIDDRIDDNTFGTDFEVSIQNNTDTKDIILGDATGNDFAGDVLLTAGSSDDIIVGGNTSFTGSLRIEQLFGSDALIQIGGNTTIDCEIILTNGPAPNSSINIGSSTGSLTLGNNAFIFNIIAGNVNRFNRGNLRFINVTQVGNNNFIIGQDNPNLNPFEQLPVASIITFDNATFNGLVDIQGGVVNLDNTVIFNSGLNAAANTSRSDNNFRRINIASTADVTGELDLDAGRAITVNAGAVLNGQKHLDAPIVSISGATFLGSTELGQDGDTRFSTDNQLSDLELANSTFGVLNDGFTTEIDINGSGPLDLFGGNTFNNPLELNVRSGRTLNWATSAPDEYFGDVSITGPGNVTLANSGTSSFYKDLTIENTGTASGGDIAFRGGNSQTFVRTFGTNDFTIDNLLVDKSADVITMDNNILVNSSVTINSGTLDAGANTLGDAPGQVATLTMTDGELIVAKTGAVMPELTGAYTITGGSLLLSGAGNQTLRAGRVYNNLTVGLTQPGTVDFSSTAATLLNGELELINGIVETRDGSIVYPLTISATGGAIGGEITSYVDGPLTRQGNGDLLFPVGKDGFFAPADLLDVTANVGDITVEFRPSRPAGSPVPPLQSVADLSWDINGAFNGEQGIFQFQEALLVNTPSDLSALRLADLQPAGYVVDPSNVGGPELVVGANDPTQGGDVIILTTLDNNLLRAGIKSIGTTDNTPLPIVLAYFRATPDADGRQVMTTWATSQEINNDYFEVERSKDGVTFEPIGRITGAGDSDETIEYSFTDERPLPGRSFYRLKQTDFDGTFSYSEVVTVSLSAVNVSVYPNPAIAGQDVKLLASGLEGRVIVDIYGVNGQLVYHHEFDADPTRTEVNLPLSGEMAPGMYLINVSDRFTTERQRVVIR